MREKPLETRISKYSPPHAFSAVKVAQSRPVKSARPLGGRHVAQKGKKKPQPKVFDEAEEEGGSLDIMFTDDDEEEEEEEDESLADFIVPDDEIELTNA